MDEALASRLPGARERYETLKSQGLRLDISRGKPGADQIGLSSPMLGILTTGECHSISGMDCRNYGCVEGIPEMRSIFADILGVPDVVLGGNSSLSMMFGQIADYCLHGVNGGAPWRQGEVGFVCPVPGYDRHFAICDYFNIKMISVEMTETGPDMDAVERLVQTDKNIKGMWCVPVYSNPTGCVYSDETVRRIAAMRPKAPDFRLFWDNAYCVHNFAEERPAQPNILSECTKNGNEDMPLIFASFSKVSFPGAAVACEASSPGNMKRLLERMRVQTVGHDKLNQLSHARFFKNADGVYAHMEKMGALLKLKFDAVISALESELEGLAEWSNPKGGYFIHFRSMDRCAKRIVQLCKEAGLTITEAGAVHPHKFDPRDRDLRIAPSYASVSELEMAMGVFCASVKLCYLEKLESINNSTQN